MGRIGQGKNYQLSLPMNIQMKYEHVLHQYLYCTVQVHTCIVQTKYSYHTCTPYLRSHIIICIQNTTVTTTYISVDSLVLTSHSSQVLPKGA